jgi:hypothetical protein
MALNEAEKSKYWALTAAHRAMEDAQSAKTPGTFAVQAVAVVRGMLGDFTGAGQILAQLPGKDKQWPLWNLTEELVAAGKKGEALALARSQEDAYARAYGLLGTAAQILE